MKILFSLIYEKIKKYLFVGEIYVQQQGENCEKENLD